MSTNGESSLVTAFIKRTKSENEKLAKALARLDKEAVLATVLSRFDRQRQGVLSKADAVFAQRVLGLLHRPSPSGLKLLETILIFLDCDTNRVLDHQEVSLATEILELFCKADSHNETLSNKELEILIAVLEEFDGDNNGVLDSKERSALRDELWEPEAFLAKHKASNAKVRALLG